MQNYALRSLWKPLTPAQRGMILMAYDQSAYVEVWKEIREKKANDQRITLLSRTVSEAYVDLAQNDDPELMIENSLVASKFAVSFVRWLHELKVEIELRCDDPLLFHTLLSHACVAKKLETV
jgi:hypothetical protein